MKTRKVIVGAAIALALFTLPITVVSATSAAYERYQDSLSEVYFKYFPIVPYDANYPTASDEFAIRYYVWQKDWSAYPLHLVPSGYQIEVYYRDDSCGSMNYVSWDRWYPTSIYQNGWRIDWSLGGTFGPATITVTVAAPASTGIYTNYAQWSATYGGRTYLHVATYAYGYSINWWSGSWYAEGTGSLGVKNGLAQSHVGHHALVWVHVVLFSVMFKYSAPVQWLSQHLDFVFGDYNPATDCWLTVQQGPYSYNGP